MAKTKRTAHEKRFDDQVSRLFDAMYEEKDLWVSCSSIDYAVFEAVERDCANNHKTVVKDLLPKAIEMAKNRDKFVVSWDWKDGGDVVISEINRVLEHFGLAFQPAIGDTGDQYEFELVRLTDPDEPQHRCQTETQ